MNRSLSVLATAATASVLAAVPAATATASPTTVTVRPGQSIQAAINAAPSGGTVVLAPGVYRENLLITKPLTLRGNRAAVLLPPARATHNRCTDDEDAQLPAGQTLPVGVCVLGVLGGPVGPGGDLPSVVTPVSGVHIDGLELDDWVDGIETDGTDGLRITNVTVRGGADGIITFFGSGTVLDHDLVTGTTGFAAASLRNSSDVRVTASRFIGNRGFGLVVEETWGGRVHGTVSADNSGGIAVIDTGMPGPTGNVVVSGNAVTRNSGYFPGDGEAPAVSGIGVALLGTTHVTVAGNRITANQPSVAAPFSGMGVPLLDAAHLTGGAAPTGNRIQGNLIAGSPVPVMWDHTGSGNVIKSNHVR